MRDRHRQWELVSRESPEVVLLAADCVISYWLRLWWLAVLVMARSALMVGCAREWPLRS